MIRITTLIENSPGEHHGLRYEHGISFFIEKDGHTLLFDTGQSGAFLPNAARLNLPVCDSEFAVLSHGHYDHSGGLPFLAEESSSFQLVTGPGFFTPKYACRSGSYDYLGSPFDEDFLEEMEIDHHEVKKETEELLPGIFVLSRFPRIHPDEVINPRFLLRTKKGFIPDPFDDEILLAVDTPRGLAVLLGCAHPGMRTMLDSVRNRLGRPIAAVLGGTHLVEAKGGALEKSLEYLRREEIEIVGVSHCTGQTAAARLQEENSRYFPNVTGSSLFF